MSSSNSTMRMANSLLGESAVCRQAAALSKAMPSFPSPTYTKETLAAIEGKPIKKRVSTMIDCLHTHLPKDFVKAAPVLGQCAKTYPATESVVKASAMAAWPLIDYIGVYGVDVPELSLPLLAKLTPLFTAEFAIRPFALKHFDLTLQHALKWCDDPSEHVRRLASEGLRPKLPWGVHLPALRKDPSPILPILEKLKNDDSLYVRKSVANTLNDISKDNPKVVLDICRRWKGIGSKRARGADKVSVNTEWIIRHATRSLVKDGCVDTLALFGLEANDDIVCKDLRVCAGTDASNAKLAARKLPTIRAGGTVAFAFELKNKGAFDADVVVDFAIHYPRQNGKSFRKVFKLSRKKVPAGELLTLTKYVVLKPGTRKLYPGRHTVEVLANGVSLSKADFDLEA